MKKNSVLLLTLFLCVSVVGIVWSSQKSSKYIKIRHVGTVNYPIFPIYIANFQKPSVQELKEVYGEKVYDYSEVYWAEIDDADMEKMIEGLSKLIPKLKSAKISKLGVQFDSGTFLLTIKSKKENGAIVLRSEIKTMVKVIEKSLANKKYDELLSKLEDLKKMGS